MPASHTISHHYALDLLQIPVYFALVLLQRLVIFALVLLQIELPLPHNHLINNNIMIYRYALSYLEEYKLTEAIFFIFTKKSGARKCIIVY